jgi:L-ascorbate metabolism protein UlaG (beta-lactamase superfamily)
MGSLVEFSSVDNNQPLLRLYVSGDTLVHDQLQEIPRRFPDIDLGLFHLGGTRVLGLMLTMDGRQGAQAVQIIAPRQALPIHYDDYDVFASPLEDFRRAIEAAGLVDRVSYLGRGERFPLTARTAASPHLQQA